MTEEETKEVKETKKEEDKFNLVQVPTQHTIAIKTPAGELISTEEGIVTLLNEVKEIKKLIG